jgi:monothiol glutaredoxin
MNRSRHRARKRRREKVAGLDYRPDGGIGKAMDIRCYLKPSCGWSNGVRAIMAKYALNYQDVDIINNPSNYAEMVEKSGQRLSPCVEIAGVMLPDISGAEVEQYLLANKLVVPNDKAPAVPIDAPCTDAEHEKMRIKTVRFF